MVINENVLLDPNSEALCPPLQGEMVSETSTEENCNCPTKDCAQWEPETDLGKIKVLDHHHQTKLSQMV